MRKVADGSWELVPIDHGYVLPDSFQDISFEWLYWPQARANFGESHLCLPTRPLCDLKATHPISRV